MTFWFQEMNEYDDMIWKIIVGSQSDHLMNEDLSKAYDLRYPLNPIYGYYAAATGNINLLSWLYPRNCEMNIVTWNFAVIKPQLKESVNRALSEASNYFLSSLINIHCHQFADIDIKVLEWLDDREIPIKPEIFAKYALMKGDVIALHWLDNNYTIDYQRALEYAGERAQQDAVDFLTEQMRLNTIM